MMRVAMFGAKALDDNFDPCEELEKLQAQAEEANALLTLNLPLDEFLSIFRRGRDALRFEADLRTSHSPILAAISVEPIFGKSTLLGVLRFLVPKPFVSVEPTGPSVYRTVDRERPTLIIDEADDLFYRKSDLRAIVNAGWSRGTKIPRQGRWYDPFCPKILGILGKTKLPRTIASRSIILRMWPKTPKEKAEDFAYADDPAFSTIRRKLARWAADNVSVIKELKPPQLPGFNIG